MLDPKKIIKVPLVQCYHAMALVLITECSFDVICSSSTERGRMTGVRMLFRRLRENSPKSLASANAKMRGCQSGSMMFASAEGLKKLPSVQLQIPEHRQHCQMVMRGRKQLDTDSRHDGRFDFKYVAQGHCMSCSFRSQRLAWQFVSVDIEGRLISSMLMTWDEHRVSLLCRLSLSSGMGYLSS